MGVYAFPDFHNNIIEKCLVWKSGTGLYLDGYLTAFALDFLYEISRLADHCNQLGNYLLTGSALVIGKALDYPSAIVVKSLYLGHVAILVIGNGDFRIYAENDHSSRGQLRYVFSSRGAAAAAEAGDSDYHCGSEC